MAARTVTALPLALAGVGSFVLGFAGIRWSERAEPVLPPVAPPPAPLVATEPAREKVDDSPAASQARTDEVFRVADQRAGYVRDHALYAALLKMDAADFLAAASDPNALLERLQKGGSGAETRGAFAEVYFGRWLALDPAAVLHFFGSTPFLGVLNAGKKWKAGNERWYAVQGGACRALARHDPQWTKDYLASRPPGPERSAGIFALLLTVARSDPAKARQFLASFPDGANHQTAVHGYVFGLAAGDPRAAFDAASAEPAGSARQELIKGVMREAGKRGVGVFRELLDRMENPASRREIVMDSLESLRNSSVEDPLPWLKEELPRGGPLYGGGWGERFAKGIADWVQGAKCGEAAEWAATAACDPQGVVFGEIVKEWGQRDPDALRTWLADSTATRDAAVVEKLGKHLREMAQNDRAAMLAWTDALPPGLLRDEAHFQAALSVGGASNLAQATAAYSAVAGRDKDGALAGQLATVLATKNAPAAVQWAMQFPEGKVRERVLGKVAEKWSQRDLRSAAAWIEQLPAGSERDRAVTEYARIAAHADPAAAAEWVSQVADPEARTLAAMWVFGRWSWENPEGARAWLRALPGVDEERKKRNLGRDF